MAQRFTEMALARRTRKTVQDRICPHCRCNDIVLHGRDKNGRQRFKCRGCRKTYNIMTGTPMARARKPEKWSKYLDCMTEHLSVRRIVATGIGLNGVTIWRWRQRFLEAAVADNANLLSGVIEADKTFFLRSFKGSRGWKQGKPPENRPARLRTRGAMKRGLSREQVPVLTALDNSGRVYQAILASLRDLEAALEGRIVAGAVLCSDGSAAYVNVADKADAEHVTVSMPITAPHAVKTNTVFAPLRQVGRLGLGRVNNQHQQLKNFVDGRCRGVATKYLRRYLGWHRAMIQAGFEGKDLLRRALCQHRQ